MKKLFTLSALAFAALSMNAGVNFSLVEKMAITENLPVATTGEAANATPQEATGKFAVGTSYVTVYGSFTNYVTNDGKQIANGYLTIKNLANDSVLLEGLAGGMDLVGVMDAAKEKITINLPQVIGQYNGEDIICYKLQVSTGKYFSSQQTYVITATENGAVGENDYGLYACASIGGFALMQNIEYTKANGKTNITFNTQTGAIPNENPINAVYDKDAKTLTITSMNANFYGSYIPTVLKVNETNKTMTIPGGVIFDRNVVSQTSQNYIICPIVASGNLDPQKDNNLNYTVTENSTTITFANETGQQFVGYNSSGTQWSGFRPYPWTITLDFSIEENPFSAVESIAADNNVAAEYYNLQGMKVNADNVKAGIYIVRKGNKATKIIVK